MESNKNLFFRGVDLLLAIKTSNIRDRYAMKLSKIIDLGYARTIKLLLIFEKNKIIEFINLNGRTKGIKLSSKGEGIANNLIRIKELLP